METPDGNAAQSTALSQQTAAPAQQVDSGQGQAVYASQTTQPDSVAAQGQMAGVAQQTAQAAQPAQAQAAQTVQMAPPTQAPAPLYPQYLNQLPETQLPVSSPVETAINAGIMGMIVVGTGAMGANLHKVQDGDMNLGEAVGNSLAKGAAGAAGAAGATYAASTLTDGGLTGLAVTLGVGTGIGYLLSGK